MKIVIIGTSNSIIGRNGYLRSLSMFHEVETYLMGRVSFLFHMQVLHENRERLEKADLIIIDHYINDLNFYYPFFGDKYIELIDLFYSFLSSFNVHLINLLFPVHNLKNDAGFALYEYILKISARFRISVVDLNVVGFRSDEYRDDVHISESASFSLGIALAAALLRDPLPPHPTAGEVGKLPIKFFPAERFLPRIPVQHFSNSLFKDLLYIRLDSSVDVPIPSDSTLLAIGYLRMKNQSEPSGITLNGLEQRALCDDGAFLEMIDQPIRGAFKIEPIIGAYTGVKNLMMRGVSSGNFLPPLLTTFVLINEGESLEVKSANRQSFRIDLGDLSHLLERISETRRGPFLLPVLRPKTVDFLRDAALEHEKNNLSLAHDLMHLAHLARPTGPQIAKKFQNYFERLVKQRQKKS